MKNQINFFAQLDTLISAALAEDIGDGDHSTLATVPASKMGRARLLVKGGGVLAGMEVARFIFHKYDSELTFAPLLKDGDTVESGNIAFEVSGKSRSILTTERLVLNCMQRMSGIATYTARLSGLIAGTGAKLLDTRKTTPNFRLLEKKR